MSVLRVCFNGKGVDKAVRIEQNEGDFSHIIVGNCDIMAADVGSKEDELFFEVGHNFGCSDEFDEFMWELAKALPDTELNYYWHSTMSGMSGSYNFGFMDGEIETWEDDEVYPCCAFYIEYNGIDKLIKCGEEDSAGFTHVWVNGKEFWLNGMSLDDSHVRFNNAEKQTRSYRGFAEEITKTVPEHEIMIEMQDFMTGEIGITRAEYKNGKYDEKFIEWQD